MRIYADLPHRHSRQLLADTLGVCWCAVALVGAWAIYRLVQIFGAPGRAVEEAGDGLAGHLRGARDGLGAIPLVGDPAAEPFDGAAGAADRLADAGQTMQDAVTVAAIVAAVSFASLALTAAVVVWVLPRLWWLRRATEARGLRDDPGGLDLLAFRALARRPLSRISALDDDIVASWRKSDPRAVRALAELELRRLGLAPPVPASPARPPRAIS